MIENIIVILVLVVVFTTGYFIIPTIVYFEDRVYEIIEKEIKAPSNPIDRLIWEEKNRIAKARIE